MKKVPEPQAANPKHLGKIEELEFPGCGFQT